MRNLKNEGKPYRFSMFNNGGVTIAESGQVIKAMHPLSGDEIEVPWMSMMFSDPVFFAEVLAGILDDPVTPDDIFNVVPEKTLCVVWTQFKEELVNFFQSLDREDMVENVNYSHDLMKKSQILDRDNARKNREMLQSVESAQDMYKLFTVAESSESIPAQPN